MTFNLNSQVKRSWRILSAALIIIIVLAIGAVARQGKLLGWEFEQHSSEQNLTVEDKLIRAYWPEAQQIVNQAGCCKVYNSSSVFLGTALLAQEFAPDVKGFGGALPIIVFLNPGDVVEHIAIVRNAEDQDYFRKVVDGGVLTAWNGQKVDEALKNKVDAITGATYSSAAIIVQMRETLAGYLATKSKVGIAQEIAQANGSGGGPTFGYYFWIVVGALTVADALWLACRKRVNRYWRRLQLALNVVVLGVIMGSFVSINALSARLAGGFLWGANWLVGVMILLVVLIPCSRK